MVAKKAIGYPLTHRNKEVWDNEHSNYPNYVTCSDSFSYLQAVAGLKKDHPFVVIDKMNQLPPDEYDTQYQYHGCFHFQHLPSLTIYNNKPISRDVCIDN